MEMAIDFVKTRSFLENLFRAFVAHDLWTFSDQPWQEGRENDLRNARNVWPTYQNPEITFCRRFGPVGTIAVFELQRVISSERGR